MSVLWQKSGEAPADWFLAFTAGKDRVFDQDLVQEDLLVNMAQVGNLLHCGVLKLEEAEALLGALRQLWKEHAAGTGYIAETDEDVHSATENHLAKRCGPFAGNIHTGRSRNDQVVADVRLWLMRRLPDTASDFLSLLRALAAFAEREKGAFIPGFTHTRSAMPSSGDVWAEGFLDVLHGQLSTLRQAVSRFDRSPLGSAAGYGVPLLPVKRDSLAAWLGFSGVQEPVAAVQLSRGADELALIDAMGYTVLTIGRMAADVIAFSDGPDAVFSLDASQTSGSSIMPQKKNPDVWELLRAAAADFQGYRSRLAGLLINQRSGYHRDLQPVKEVLMEALPRFRQVLVIAAKAIEGIRIKPQLARAEATLFATEEALRLVVDNGIPFREAYRNIGQSLDAVVPSNDFPAGYRHSGAPGSFDSQRWNRKLAEENTFFEAVRQRFFAAEQNLRTRPLSEWQPQENS